MSDIKELIHLWLTKDDIINILRTESLKRNIPFAVSGRIQREKELLIDHVLANDDPRWRDALIEHISSKDIPIHTTQQVRRARQAERVRAHRQGKQHAKKANDQHDSGEAINHVQPLVTEQDLSKFLNLPSNAESIECFRNFYDSTCNETLRVVTCAVCARSRHVVGDKVSNIPLRMLQNRDRLRPNIQHNDQDLIEGYLLEREGCSLNETEGWKINICLECQMDLKVSDANRPLALLILILRIRKKARISLLNIP
jgi:hypothetical protein